MLSTRHTILKLPHAAAFLAAFVLFALPAANANKVMRTDSGNNVFGTGPNWVGGSAPANDLTTDIASYQAATIPLNFNPQLRESRSIKGLEFTSGTGAWTFIGKNGNTTEVLTIGASGIVSDAASTQTFNNKSLGIALGANASFTSNSTGALLFGSIMDLLSLSTFNLTLNGSSTNASNNIGSVVSGTGRIIKSGTGTSTLSGTNTFTGGTTISAGTLNINAAAALGTGALTISGGTLNNSTAGAITLSTNNAQNWNGDFAFTGTRSLNLGTGAVALSASRIVTADANALTVGGVISGVGFGLTKAGAGSLVLTSANTYTGATTISAGTLALGSVGSFVDSTVINLGTTGSTGTLDLTAKSSFAFGSGQTLTGVGTVNIGSGKIVTVGGTFAPGNSTGIVNVIGDFTLSSGAISNFEINGPTAGTNFDQLNVSGLLTYGGALNLIFGSTIDNGITLDLFGLSGSGSTGSSSSITATGIYAGSFTNNSGNWTFSTGSQIVTFAQSSGNLSFAAVPEPSTYAALLGAAALGFVVWRRRRAPKLSAAKPANQTHLTFPARAGQVILFESWLRHEVAANRTSAERISVSFNYNWS